VAVLYETVREGNRALDAGDHEVVGQFLAQVQAMLSVLGLSADDPIWGNTPTSDLTDLVDGLVQALLDQRAAARTRKDFEAADMIRNQLTDMGLTIEDTPQGPRWSLD
jgi:cysteinyl-tRNA synthetase